ncbi:MAG TPA: UxaA family hydrolase [Chloroflexota bacterium]|nr:UxaA family hydrolase [Chloroflexota bacterium]
MSALSTLPDTFLGYRRADGGVGTRNHLLVVPSVVCANTVAQRVASLIPGAVSVPHPHGCAQVGDDVVLTEKVLAGAAANPNVGAALVIGLGCETCQSGEVAELARALAPGKPVESFSIQEAGGSIKAISRGVEEGKRLLAQIAAQRREPVPTSELVLARDRGHEDSPSLAVADPVAQIVEQLVLSAGGTVLIPEFLAPLTARPNALSFAERPTGKGRHVMRTPDVDNVSVSAMAAGGSQVCVFTTGKGSPLGNAVCPVIKVCADPETNERMSDNIDFSAAGVADGSASADELGGKLFRLLLDVSSGQLTSAEIIGHQEFAIHRVGPTV